MTAGPRKKIVVINPFAVYPPTTGGQNRVFYLFKNMTHFFDVVILCFSDRRSYREISQGLFQLTIPKSPLHCKLELEFYKEFGVYTCALAQHFAQYTPEFTYFLNQYLNTAAFVILSHPYLIHELDKVNHTAAMIYDAHNVEFDLHQLILPNNASYLLKDIYQTEKAACLRASLITTCSQYDADRLADLYNISRVKFRVVPNGADLNAIHFVNRQERGRQKELQRLNKPVAFFMGSDFLPNVEAVKYIVDCAENLPNIDFRILGSVSNRFKNDRLPVNMKMLGLVSEEKKSLFLGISDIALNPILSGSGTSLKILEYMTAGIPVVTTPAGARGTGGIDGIHFVTCDRVTMPEKISLLLNDPNFADSIAKHAYTLIESKFNWQRIAQNLTMTLERMVT